MSTTFVGPEKERDLELNKELWIGLAIAFGLICCICTACVCYAEFCRNAQRKYETIEMVAKRQQHIDRGDHDTWDI